MISVGAILAFILNPPWWTKYAAALAVVIAAGGYVYHLGYASADAKWKAKEQDRIIYAQAVAVSRLTTVVEESAKQREQEAQDARDRASVIAARLAELEADAAEQAKQSADLETDLRAAVTDKGKADALVAKLRAAPRNSCRATSRDIDVDNRLRRKR